MVDSSRIVYKPPWGGEAGGSSEEESFSDSEVIGLPIFLNNSNLFLLIAV